MTASAARRAATVALAPMLVLAACNKPAPAPAAAAAPLAALPMTDAPAAPSVDAPAARALPAAPPVRVARLRDPASRYAYLDRAYAYGYGYGDAPPDYTFSYGGVDPYAWRADDGNYRVAEPLGGGRWRYFYYEPGANRPFLIRDPDYAYGYSDGALSVVYGPNGEVVPTDYYGPRLEIAAALLARAVGLYDASRDRSDWRAVSRADWDRRRAAFSAERARWSSIQAQNPDWRAYHDANAAGYQAHFADERVRREAEAARFAQAQGDASQARRDWASARQAQTVNVRVDPTINLRDGAPPPARAAFDRGGPALAAGALDRGPGPGFGHGPGREGGRFDRDDRGPGVDRGARFDRGPGGGGPGEDARRAQAQQQQSQAEQARQAQHDQQRQAFQQQAREQQRAQTEQVRQAQHDQQRQTVQQQAREQQRAQAEQARQAQHDQQRGAPQDQAREQQRAQAEQARQAQHDQQRQAFQQQAREQQRAQAEQAHQAQHDQQRQALRQQARAEQHAPAEQARQAQHAPPQAHAEGPHGGPPGGGPHGHGHGGGGDRGPGGEHGRGERP